LSEVYNNPMSIETENRTRDMATDTRCGTEQAREKLRKRKDGVDEVVWKCWVRKVKLAMLVNPKTTMRG